MSWNNPTQEEAGECYSNARTRYVNAANQYNSNNRTMDSYRSQVSSVNNQYCSCRSNKINFQKRIKEIGSIINILEGSGGFFSANVPSAIGTAGNAVQKADESFRQCIRCDGISAPDMSEVFKCKTVQEDNDSSESLQGYKSEKARLEQAVEELDRNMKQLEAKADELVRNINDLAVRQQSLKKTMMGSAFEMAHYKKYT